MQGEIVDSLKELLARQKSMELPLPVAPTPQAAPSIPTTSVSWQPSTQVIQLFEKMIDQLSYMHENGIQTTTVTLGSSEFSSSIFKGCTLTITEYSTAPKIFNIQFALSPQAASYFAPHAQQLQNALKQGQWDFRVERMDIEMLDSRQKREEEEQSHE